jgi:nicotinamide riboside transporter PnuC
MPETVLFQTHLVLGYVAWMLCFGAYAWPRLKAMNHVDAQRAIAALHSFRFFGLVFILPGVVGPHLPAGFATAAAEGDLATGVLAMLALLAIRRRRLFWLFVVAFNVVGFVDLVMAYVHAIRTGLPASPGELGAAYVIPIIYVPLLMITHVAAFRLLLRAPGRRHEAAQLQA